MAKNQLLHRLFDTPNPLNISLRKLLIISNNVPRTCVRSVSETFAEKVVQKQRSRTVVMYLNPYSRQGENFTRERLHKQDFGEDVKKIFGFE